MRAKVSVSTVIEFFCDKSETLKTAELPVNKTAEDIQAVCIDPTDAWRLGDPLTLITRFQQFQLLMYEFL